MIKKVIYIHYLYFQEFEYTKYGCQIMQDNGFETEVWNCPKLFYPDADIPEDICRNKNIFLIESYWEFLKKLLKEKRNETMFLMLSPQSMDATSYLQMIIKLYGSKYCMIYKELVLDALTCGKTLPKIKFDLNKTIFDFLFSPTFNFMITKKQCIFLPNKYRVAKKTNIYIHTLDYDKYLVSQNDKPLIEENYILLIPQPLGSHRDYKLLRMRRPKIDTPEYNLKVNKMLDILEEKYHCKTIISPHPRISYGNMNPFNGRKIITGKTNELAKNALFVVSCFTTSIDYVILYKRPFVFYYDNEVKKSIEWKESGIAFQKFFNIKPVNVSEDLNSIDWNEYTVTPENRNYKKYMTRYIKQNGTPEKMFFEVVAEKLKGEN